MKKLIMVWLVMIMLMGGMIGFVNISIKKKREGKKLFFYN